MKNINQERFVILVKGIVNAKAQCNSIQKICFIAMLFLANRTVVKKSVVQMAAAVLAANAIQRINA